MIWFIVIVMILDISVPNISVFAGSIEPSSVDVTVFIIMVLIYALAQFVILRFIKQTSRSLKSRMLRNIHHTIAATQILLIVLLLLIIIQMLIYQRYDLLLFKLIIWISCVSSVILLGILAQKFLFWFRSNRNLSILLYSITITLLSANAIFIILDVTSSLTRFGENEYIEPFSGKVANVALLGIDTTFHLGYILTSILSFIMMWIATVILLSFHAAKIGKFKYWIIVTIPLVYFLSEFQTYILDLLTQFRLSDPILFGIIYTFAFSATRPLGGLLFGIAFWSIGRKINDQAVKNYMTISAFGVMLVFSSNEVTGLILAHYPPFGLASISFLGLASYLLLVGVYSSAISIANDVLLRRSMKRTMLKESVMLDKIATSQIESEINNRITTVARRFSDETKKTYLETGVESSLKEDDIKEYLRLTLEEIEKSKKKADV
jgi:hypothetical protein